MIYILNFIQINLCYIANLTKLNLFTPSICLAACYGWKPASSLSPLPDTDMVTGATDEFKYSNITSSNQDGVQFIKLTLTKLSNLLDANFVDKK